MEGFNFRQLPPAATAPMQSAEEALSSGYRYTRTVDQFRSDETAWNFYWEENYFAPMRAALGDDAELPDPPDFLQADLDPDSFMGKVDLFFGYETKADQLKRFNDLCMARLILWVEVSQSKASVVSET
jgi:hypothetical protein